MLTPTHGRSTSPSEMFVAEFVKHDSKFKDNLNWSEEKYDRFVRNTLRVNESIASELHVSTGMSPQFWLGLQYVYEKSNTEPPIESTFPKLDVKSIKDVPDELKDGREIIGMHEINGGWSFEVIRWYDYISCWVDREGVRSDDCDLYYIEFTLDPPKKD